MKTIPTPGRRGFLGAIASSLAALLLPTSLRARATQALEMGTCSIELGRRVVTGLDEEGKSCLADLGPIPSTAQWSRDGVQGMDFWVLDRVPAKLDETENPPEGWRPVNEAPPGGAIGRLITWPPGFEYPMHATPTLDYVVVLSGELELGLETDTVILGPGDVLVQRGTAHSWRVHEGGPVTALAVLFDA